MKEKTRLRHWLMIVTLIATAATNAQTNRVQVRDLLFTTLEQKYGHKDVRVICDSDSFWTWVDSKPWRKQAIDSNQPEYINTVLLEYKQSIGLPMAVPTIGKPSTTPQPFNIEYELDQIKPAPKKDPAQEWFERARKESSYMAGGATDLRKYTTPRTPYKTKSQREWEAPFDFSLEKRVERAEKAASAAEARARSAERASENSRQQAEWNRQQSANEDRSRSDQEWHNRLLNNFR